MTDHTPTPPDSPTFDQQAAALFAGVSAKTLERLAAAGEPVGRIKVGRRVLFLRKQLEAYLAAKLTTTATH